MEAMNNASKEQGKQLLSMLSVQQLCFLKWNVRGSWISRSKCGSTIRKQLHVEKIDTKGNLVKIDYRDYVIAATE